jgi:hypothetical protein
MRDIRLLFRLVKIYCYTNQHQRGTWITDFRELGLTFAQRVIWLKRKTSEIVGINTKMCNDVWSGTKT